MTKVSERDIAEAIKMVENGEKVTKVARDYGIYASTLSRRLKGARPHRNAHDNSQTLSKLQEQELEDWILYEERCGRAPSKRIVRDVASQIATGIEPSDHSTYIGKNWVNKFVQRHPHLATKLGRVIDADRIDGINSKAVYGFYILVDRVLKKYFIEPEDIHNMDETGVQEGEAEEGTVVGTSRLRRSRIQKSGASGWMTAIHSINALGLTTTTVYILRGITLQA